MESNVSNPFKKAEKKRIGMLYPSSGVSEEEVAKILPEGVSLHVTRIPMSAPSFETEWHMADSVEEAAELLAHARVDIIVFNCTMGSLIKGKGYDQEIISRISKATGIPATTTTTAVVAGLKALGMKNFVLVSPYARLLHDKEKFYLEGEGFKVLKDRALELADCFEQHDMEPRRWYEVVKGLQDPSADGYFVSCGGIRVVDAIEKMEAVLNKPVITSNQAVAWHCLRQTGIQEPLNGFGCLLKTAL